MQTEQFDKIIIGAGLYGLYAALFCSSRMKQRILVLEIDPAPFMRATYINQARIHQGYHYPRSISTALKSAGYFERFNKDYNFCINRSFDQIYATSTNYSWTNGKQFREFCKAAGIPCEELNPGSYFKKGMCDGAFRAREYTYDAMILKEYLLEKLKEQKELVTIHYGVEIYNIYKENDVFTIESEGEKAYQSEFVLNASYAGTNQILEMAGFEKFKIKYELCEIILCETNEKLQNVGFTIMDGPFFSIMPFGKTSYHSLTSVTFTPHTTCYESLPSFACQSKSNEYCSPIRLGNCNQCPAKPVSAYPYMANLAHKYMKDEYAFSYKESLFSMKPILITSEINDSRPTVIRKYCENPTFIGVLSGKINTVYDLDEVLVC